MLRRCVGVLLLVPCVALGACGDDGPRSRGTDADRHGVGAACTSDAQCAEGQACLDFKDGYCGIEDCHADSDCPQGSACVAHADGSNYCFLLCDNKLDCNLNRPVDGEANCVSSIVFVESEVGHSKACEPPSG
jgi:hypothetical protein